MWRENIASQTGSIFIAKLCSSSSAINVSNSFETTWNAEHQLCVEVGCNL